MADWFRCTTIAVVATLILCMLSPLWADENHRQSRDIQKQNSVKDSPEKQNKAEEKSLKPVTNAAYKEKCGACHLAYQAELLPSASWVRILANISEHFGEGIDLDAESKQIIGKYLTENSADRSTAKLARKIKESLKGQTPNRITEIPYIRHEHRELPREVFSREPVGSFSNCSACHRSADQGKYDDDVTLPE